MILCILKKVNLDDLELNIQTQISEYVPVMSAPTLAKRTTNSSYFCTIKGQRIHNTKIMARKIHEIGTNIAALDGFYKEYNKSLVRLDELQNQMAIINNWKKEYLQGVSANPYAYSC